MSDNRVLYIEEAIFGAVKGLLTGRVNELLGGLQFTIPVIELGNYRGTDVIVPAITLASCERTEKERIILLDAYVVTITFRVSDTDDSDLFCYVYGAMIDRALTENPTLGGVVDRARITGKKYNQANEVVITLRITTEGFNYVS
ncbi:MAG: hypothetical protein LBI03_06540 [Clostridiales bacterium]|jgi:hypothetical protein|nr:hypothetical protein [Clostridiales bacterium]